MGCCSSSNDKKVNPAAAAAVSQAARQAHPLSKHNNPEELLVLATPKTVFHEEVAFKNKQGLKLVVQKWAPRQSKDEGAVKAPLACVVGLHGLNTHVGYTFATIDYKYPTSMLEYYNNHNIVAYCVDHQGHGKSEGVKPRTEHGHVGHVRSFDDVARDIWQLVEEVVHKEYPDTPVFIHGHCMGAAHLLRAMQLRPPAEQPKYVLGLVLSAPSYMIPAEAKPSKVVMAALGVLATVTPNKVVADWPDRNDSDLDTRFYNDPYCTPTAFSAHYAYQLQKLYNHLDSAPKSLHLPMLVFQGQHDTYVKPECTRQLFDMAPAKHKTMIHITDMNHGLLHETGCHTLFVIICNWLRAQVELNQQAQAQAQQAGAGAGALVDAAAPVDAGVDAADESKGTAGATATATSIADKDGDEEDDEDEGKAATALAPTAPTGVHHFTITASAADGAAAAQAAATNTGTGTGTGDDHAAAAAAGLAKPAQFARIGSSLRLLKVKSK